MQPRDYSLTWTEFDDGRGFVVVRNADSQRLRWQTLPRRAGIESLPVVGEQYHPLGLNDPTFAPGRSVRLVRQPQNPHDPNAVAVFNSDESLQVGFLPRDEAKRIAKLLDTGKEVDAFAIWEMVKDGQRTQVRLLLLRPNASIDLGAIGTVPRRAG